MKDASYVAAANLRPRAKRAKACADVCGEVCNVEVIHADAVRAARAALPSPAEGERLVGLFAAFANATRLALLAALRSAVGRDRPELCVCDLVAITGASQSMVSHQLSILRQLGLATPRREGRLIYYRLAPGPLAELLDDALALARGRRP
ncbi:MAG: metalloregulator ArsR/SmtB family transcription factor [Polyangiales bacterium]